MKWLGFRSYLRMYYLLHYKNRLINVLSYMKKSISLLVPFRILFLTLFLSYYKMLFMNKFEFSSSIDCFV